MAKISKPMGSLSSMACMSWMTTLAGSVTVQTQIANHARHGKNSSVDRNIQWYVMCMFVKLFWSCFQQLM